MRLTKIWVFLIGRKAKTVILMMIVTRVFRDGFKKWDLGKAHRHRVNSSKSGLEVGIRGDSDGEESLGNATRWDFQYLQKADFSHVK